MSKLESLFEEFKIPKSYLEKISNVFWKTQECNEDGILFYKFNDPESRNEIKLFYDRIQKSNFKICIINNDKIQIKDVYSVAGQFDRFQQRCLDAIYPINKNLMFFGVTGTNGKTTTVDLARQLLVASNKNVMTVGTLGIYINNRKVNDFSLTTPALIDLYKVINKHKESIDFVFMEMSSHALIQKRFGDIKFEKIAWTNFSQDHLDYHKTMEEYFEAKSLIRNYVRSDHHIIIPRDQKELINKLKFMPKTVKVEPIYKNSFFRPDYNLENLALALELISDITRVENNFIEALTPPPGRFNILEYKSSFIVVDFAHTPDAIYSIAKEIKNSFPDKKLKIVLGCGGDRDRSKRAPMGKAASEFANFIYLTSDNPRFEDPSQIIGDIVPGISTRYEIEVDRKITIIKAMANLNNEVLLIVGKGHEAYLDIKGVKHPYSDIETVQEYIND